MDGKRQANCFNEYNEVDLDRCRYLRGRPVLCSYYKPPHGLIYIGVHDGALVWPTQCPWPTLARAAPTLEQNICAQQVYRVGL